MTIRHDIRALRREAAARRAYAFAELLGEGRDSLAAQRHASHLMRSARRERVAHLIGG